MFDYINFILFATSTPILVNIAFRHPYSWLHTILLAQAFAVFFSFCSLIDAIFVQPFLFSSLRELPTAGQDPIWTRLFKEPTGDQLLRFMRQSPSSQIIRYFGVLNSERLLLTDPKDLKQVLDSEAYEFGRSYLIRRLLSPINGVDGQTPGPDNAVEILKWLEKTTFQVIVTAVFGTTTADIQTHIEDLLAEFRDAFSISSGLHAQAEMAWETILPSHLFFGLIPLDDVRKAKSSMQGIKAYCQKQIAKRRLEYTPESRKLPDKNILDTAIKSEDLSDEEILQLCTTFLATGYKTVSVAALLRTEVRRHFPAPGQAGSPPFKPDLLQNMPVLTAVCNETLRFAPLVHLTFREARTDILLSGSNQVVPEGTILAISPWAIHRSPVYWRGGESSVGFSSTSHTACPSPSTWDMTRWLLDKKGGARMQCSFMPFGRGPRSCIAETFARDEMAILLAALVGRFDFSFRSSGRDGNATPEDLRVSFGVAAKPVKLIVRAQPVDGW
ncbi:cytochrome P450 [Aureobasidium pullulans EXF-150]|uniref:Cytochrome P450 n=1 Tax=Aureobasidium pullulans EXF-150 TaxID=1043002 RepID=A0A074Y142_AURPU|nr:cytochrome P450 [Aureobasidium pullulans EXF-150]KEQ87937.1 cytochrome P450 [Aureobasidium pullulans EXF-150]